MTGTTRKTVGYWATALLVAAAALLLMALSGAAGAQEPRSADLDVDKTVSPKSVPVGGQQTFTIRITNEGTARAEGVRMRDPLPSKVRFIRASTSRHVPGSCGIEDRVVKCRLGNLRVDHTVTVKIYVKSVVSGSYTNRAYASFNDSSALGRASSEISDAAKAIAEPRGK